MRTQTIKEAKSTQDYHRPPQYINSIRNKFESLVSFVGNNLDILMVSETRIDDTFPESQFLIEGFSKPFRHDRTAKGGGILLYIREDIPCKYIKNHFKQFV